MDVIAGELQDRDYGIVVLTRENMHSPWINFEAGALGKTLGVGKVAPLLLDLTRADVVGPISQFQSTLLTQRDDVRQFIRDVALLAPGIPEESIDALFEAKWFELESVIERATGMDRPQTTRSAESMLEEVLERVRRIERQSASGGAEFAGRPDDDVVVAAIGALQLPKGSAPVMVSRGTNRDGLQLRIDAHSEEAQYDAAALQVIADAFNTAIFLKPHGVKFTPAGRAKHNENVGRFEE